MEGSGRVIVWVTIFDNKTHELIMSYEGEVYDEQKIIVSNNYTMTVNSKILPGKNH
jgi:hypothetical protein